MWITLTVCGQTRLGYGSADGKSGGDAVKEIIGDALRNAAMRFGAALDLWHKGDLHQDTDGEDAHCGSAPAKPSSKAFDAVTPEQFIKLRDAAEEAGVAEAKICEAYKTQSFEQFPAQHFDSAMKRLSITIAEKTAKKPDAATEEEIPYEGPDQ